MKIDPALQLAGLKSQQGQDRSVSFPAGDDWASKLKLGQVIKGRVLRTFGDGRYAVDFGGEQRIVDSSIPFSAGDILRGRVTGLSERVTVERLPERHGASAQAEDRGVPQPAPLQSNEDPIVAAAGQWRIALDNRQADAIANAIRGAANPDLAVRVGLFLAKLGLPVSADAVRALSERAAAGGVPSGAVPTGSLAATLAIEPSTKVTTETRADRETISDLARWLATDAAQRTLAEGFPANAAGTMSPATPPVTAERERGEGGDTWSDDRHDRRLEAILGGMLNVQTGARYQHRFQTLPVIVDGRLREFDLALFDHAARGAEELGAKRLRFSLATDHGALDIDARVVNDHVHIAFTSDRLALLDEMERGSGDLAAALGGHGWQLDGVVCREARISENAASAIVDHVLAQDSLQVAL